MIKLKFFTLIQIAMIRFAIIFSLILWLYPEVIKSQDLVDQVKESFTDIQTVNVKGIFCNVDVEPGVNGSVSLEGEIRATRKYEDLRIRYEKNGTTLDVWVEKPNSLIGQVKGFLILTVPVSVKLDVKTVSGSIKVEGLGREEMVLSAVSGSISATNIPCQLNVSTVSGSIEASVIDGNLTASAVSGSVTVDDVKGVADLKTVSGSIHAKSVLKSVTAVAVSGSVNVDGALSDVRCKSVSNSINIFNVKGNVSASNTSGSISMTSVVGEVQASSTSGSIRGSSVMLTGNSAFNNTSGSIDIDLQNEAGTLSFDLRSASGSLEAMGMSGSKRMTTGTGPVKITGATVSGSQKYR
jgi:DUF4097 and DUF4098 domain-containing protein YvlB